MNFFLLPLLQLIMKIPRCKTCKLERVRIEEVPSCFLQSVVELVRIVMHGNCSIEAALVYDDRVVYISVLIAIVGIVMRMIRGRREERPVQRRLVLRTR